MSRTSKTDPYRVKILRHRQEHHDHRDGVCDLAANPDAQGYKAGACYIDADWNNPTFRCGCAHCDSAYGGTTRRQERLAARRATRRYVPDADQD